MHEMPISENPGGREPPERSGRPMRRLFIPAAAAAGVLFVASVAGLAFGRSLFNEPGVRELKSVRDELGAERLLFVFAHPDDEITANALIARAKNEGLAVYTLTATRGEAGAQYPPVVDQPHLGVVREGELRKHLFALGVDRATILDLGDGKLESRDFETLVGLVAAEIADTRADAVITFHPESGVSDHRDHKRIGAATREAAGRSEAAPTLYYVLGPRPALNRFGGETGAKVAAHQPPPAFAVKAPARDKKRAWRIHQSQSEFLQAAWGLSPTVLYLLWTEEYYARADETGAP